MKQFRRFGPAVALGAALLLIGSLPSAGASAPQSSDLTYAEDVQIVEPCCVGSVQHPAGTLLRRNTRPRSVHEGTPVDAETLRQMRQDAAAHRLRGNSLEARQETGPEPAAPTSHDSFEGLGMADAGFFIPPDTQVAAGPNHVLQAVNTALRLSGRDGKGAVVQTGEEHFGLDPSEASLFDPKLYYDPLSGRFFILFLDSDFAKTSSAWLSVSRSDSPDSLTAANWCNYKINTKKGKTWADYPGLGVNEKWLAFSTNNFKFSSGFGQAYWFVADKTVLVDNAAGCPGASFSRLSLKKDKGGAPIFTPQAAQHLTPTGIGGTPLYGLAAHFSSFDAEYALFTLIDSNARGTGRPAISNQIIEGSGYAMPPTATQKGSTEELDTGDIRVMQQLVYVDGQMWGVHTSGCFFDSDPDTTVTCIRVVRVRPDDTTPAIDFEDLFGRSQHFVWWPGIGVAGNGDVVSVFQISGKKYRLSTGYNGLKRGAARFGRFATLADEFDKLKISAKGKCATELLGSDDLVRTGDYVGVARDPDSKGVWISGEYGAKIPGDCGWGTKIARVSY